MLQKPRSSGKMKKPKVSNDKRMSAPSSQLGTQTMMLKQPQTAPPKDNDGDLMDLLGFAANNPASNNNNNGAANPFDIIGDRPGLSTSKSNPFEYGNNTNTNTNSAFDAFGSGWDNNPFAATNSNNSNTSSNTTNSTLNAGPKLTKQLSHPVGTSSGMNNSLFSAFTATSNNKAPPSLASHGYQDSHAQLDPFMDLEMFDTTKQKSDPTGGLSMIVDEKTNSNNNDADTSTPPTSKAPEPPSKVTQPNDNNDDDELDDDDHKKKMHKHKHGKKRKSGKHNHDKDKDKDKDKEKDKSEDDKKLETNALEELHRGSALLKYPRRSGFPHFKHIQLSKDNTRIQWYSKRKALDETCILVKDIREVVKGQKTETFKKFQQRTLEKSSFSIVYGMDYKSLDVAAKSIDECQMWVKAITELYKVSRSGGDLTKLKELYVGIHFKDRNRPRSRQGSGNFIRANNSKTLKIDPESLKEIEKDMETLHKNFEKVSALTQKAAIQKSDEYQNISTVLSEIEERMEELTQEVANIRDTELAKREVWRANVDLNAMLEKVEVLSKLLDRRKSNLF